MSIPKKLKQGIIDPESNEWLFNMGFIQLVVGPEGMDIQVTDEGRGFLAHIENDEDLMEIPVKEKMQPRRTPIFRHSRTLVILIFALLFYILWKSLRG